MFEFITLKTIIKENNIIPKKKLGQNFIFNSKILDKIIKNILPINGYNIIEIGPGPGGLTLSILKKKPNQLILIEKDPAFKNILNNILANYNDIKSNIIIDDFLKLNLNNLINSKTKILSNLPYYISTQILLKIIPLNIFVNEVMFTFQKEVADRIVARPNSKNYSRLSVVTQAVCNIKKIQNIPPEVFYPIPKVHSSVLIFTRKKNTLIEDYETLLKLTKTAFNKRRKIIKNSLKNLDNISKYLLELKIDENIRPEQISVDNYCKLANLIFRTKK